jgi:hypothetical protein
MTETTKKKAVNFDDARWIRRARNQLTKETEGMSSQECADYINSMAQPIIKEYHLEQFVVHTNPARPATATAR